MSLLSKLKDAVIEEEPQPVAAPAHTSVSVAAPVMRVQTSDMDLRAKISGSGQSNIFFATLKSLAAYIPEEGSRYKAAKDMLAAQGITPGAIAADVGAILTQLDTECRNFDAAKSSKEAADVTTREARISEIDNQIHQLEAERTSVVTALVSAKQLIEQKQKEFYDSANALRDEYQGSLAKIKGYCWTTIFPKVS